MKPLARSTSPFDTKVPVNKAVTWVEPILVCNIKFSEITQGGILRHPVFMGLRVDKSAAETDHLERPKTSVQPVPGRVKRPATKQSRKVNGQRSIVRK